MICLSCPHCASPLEFADELVGFETACYACANPIQVPTASVNRVPPADPATEADVLADLQSSAHQPWREPPRTHRGLGLVSRVRLVLGAIVIATGCIGLYLSGGGVL